MEFFLNQNEQRLFEKYFNLHSYISNETEVITFDKFIIIVTDSLLFSNNITSSFIDQLKRKSRELSNNEAFEISKVEFFQILEELVRYHDKKENENDDQLKLLFDLFAINDIINKKYLLDMITSFELPINVDDFFSPLKKKEEIGFSDFCSLFKRNKNESDFMISTFASSFYNLKEKKGRISSQEDVFPIEFNCVGV
jgi:hypothetical protein